jgi:hypothetical protein
MPNISVYTLADAAAKLGVEKRSLVDWEWNRIIPPAKRLRRNEHRIYTQEDLVIIKEAMRIRLKANMAVYAAKGAQAKVKMLTIKTDEIFEAPRSWFLDRPRP